MTGNTVSVWIAELGIWPLVIVLVLNLFFRRYGSQGYKRMANLYQAIGVFLITTVASFIAARELIDLYFYIGVAVVVAAMILLRKKVFPYRRTCVRCGANLDIETIYIRDENLCSSCRKEEEDEEALRKAGEVQAKGEIEEPQETESTNTAWPGSHHPEEGGNSPD